MMEADEPIDVSSGKIKIGLEKDPGFISGVVEGFYGRPWTPEQRKDLFVKMGRWGMNAYLYAPKDDYKHRAYWREQYSVDEAEHLTALISAAKEHNIIFIYALSPGLDIAYSSAKELSTLKRKLDQVAEFGCEAFALLFDDILPEMSDGDKEVFQSFAHAQVSVTNEVFEHLGRTRFLFCPTQYSASRAVPDVPTSEYLQTIGSKLVKDIDIMWTGPRVVSKEITEESLEELHQVFGRYPVIWDNIHANDYDPKRVFLGPYCGRSPRILRRLRGVMTNPNCEYECNFVGIHTLAQWTRCSSEAEDECSESKFEAEGFAEEGEGLEEEDASTNLPSDVYHPRRALKAAVREWASEFSHHKMPAGIVAAPPGAVTVAVSLLAAPPTVVVPIPVPVPVPGPIAAAVRIPPPIAVPTAGAPAVTSDRWPTPARPDAALPPVTPTLPIAGEPTPVQVDMVQSAVVNTVVTVPMMNSLASSDKVLVAPLPPPPSLIPAIVAPPPGTTAAMPMPMAMSMSVSSSPSPVPVPAGSVSALDLMRDEEMVDLHGVGGGCQHHLPNSSNHDGDDDVHPRSVDVFYLPHAHGPLGLRILAEFNWLKMNANLASDARKAEAARRLQLGGASPQALAQIRPEVQEWSDRAANFGKMSEQVDQLLAKIRRCPNRSLVYCLYPYVWDMRGIVSLLNAYVVWLGCVPLPENFTNFVTGVHTWYAKGWREAFTGGDQEPWVFRGGLTGDLQRLIPVDSPNELFVYSVPDIPGTKVYSVRPYRPSDERSVYEVCRMTCNDGGELPEVFREFPDLVPEKFAGGFLALCPEMCFVAESEDGDVVGYIVGAPDYESLRHRVELAWVPELRRKYPRKIPQDVCDRLSHHHHHHSHLRKTPSPTTERMPVDGEEDVVVAAAVASAETTAMVVAGEEEEDNPMLAPLEHVLEALHSNDSCCLPDVPRPILTSHPATIRAGILSSVADPSLSKKLITCLMAALRSTGVFGAFTELTRDDVRLRDFYSKLGFQEIRGVDCAASRLFLGRNF